MNDTEIRIECVSGRQRWVRYIFATIETIGGFRIYPEPEIYIAAFG